MKQPFRRLQPSKQGFWTQWKNEKKRVQFGIGCLFLIGMLTFCGICSASNGYALNTAFPNAIKDANATATAQAIADTNQTQVALSHQATQQAEPTIAPTKKPTPSRPTPTPTVPPTATPTATPTQQPTPTPVPTVSTQPTPTPIPTTAPQPTATTSTGVNGNPWGYNFVPGNLIYSPPAAFCDYFACIGNFWNGHGYVEECNDGDYSLSGGIRGACSYHGGPLQPLYSH